MRYPKIYAFVILALACVATFLYVKLSKPRIGPDSERLAWCMKVTSAQLWQLSNWRSLNSNITFPADYVVKDDPDCVNSWRAFQVYEANFETGIVFESDPHDPVPDLQKCWHSSVNKEWDDFWFRVYCISGTKESPREKRYTNYMAIIGPSTPFTSIVDGSVQTLKELPADAIVLMEVVQSEVPWMKAGDIELSELESAAKERQELLGSASSPDGRWVAFADGAVWLLDKSTPISALLPFCTVQGAEEHDRDQELGGFFLQEFFPPPAFR